jgi:hypothetical protein
MNMTSYLMNPATDTLLYGDELKDGMKVLLEWSVLRNHEEGRLDEFFTITRLGHDGNLIRFIALYDDGYMKSGTYNRSYAWIVRKPQTAYEPLDMDPEIRAQWAAALRSGDYQQTSGLLHRTIATSAGKPAGYCCLGVLCDLAEKAGVVTSRIVDSGVVSYGGTGATGSETSLPAAVQAWAGLTHGDPRVRGNDLSIWNDSHRKTFAEIADLIEGIGE